MAIFHAIYSEFCIIRSVYIKLIFWVHINIFLRFYIQINFEALYKQVSRIVNLYYKYSCNVDLSNRGPFLWNTRYNYFLATFSAILEKLLESIFRKVPKTVFLGQNVHLFARLAKFGQNENFPQKRALLSFYPYCPLTSCQVS